MNKKRFDELMKKENLTDSEEMELFDNFFEAHRFNLGDSAYSPKNLVQVGHNATITAIRTAQNGDVWVLLTFTIISTMSKWCKVEDVVIP